MSGVISGFNGNPSGFLVDPSLDDPVVEEEVPQRERD